MFSMDSSFIILSVFVGAFCIVGTFLLFAFSRAENQRKLRESEGLATNSEPDPLSQSYAKSERPEHPNVPQRTMKEVTRERPAREEVQQPTKEDLPKKTKKKSIAPVTLLIVLLDIGLVAVFFLVPVILHHNQKEQEEKQEEKAFQREYWEQRRQEQQESLERNKNRPKTSWDNTPQEVKDQQGRRIQEQHVKKMQASGQTYLQKILEEVKTTREHYTTLPHYKKTKQRLGGGVHGLAENLWDTDFLYHGEFEDSYEGNGHLRWSGGDYVDGLFSNGWIEQGIGAVHLTGNRYYEGQFMGGYPQGFGRMTYADGRVEEGVFSQGEYHGEY